MKEENKGKESNQSKDKDNNNKDKDIKCEEKSKNKIKKTIGAVIIQSILMASAAYGILVLIKSSSRMSLIIIAITALILFGLDYIFFRFTHINRKVAKLGTGFVIAIINLCIAFGVAVYCLAPSLLFYPNYDAEIYQEVKGYENTEEVLIPTKKGQINGWFYHNADDAAPLIIYYAGNGENASRRMQCIHIDNLEDIFAGYNFAVFSYPGYEKSTGSPSSTSLKEMGLAVYDEMVKRPDVDPQKIYLWGYSIGTGVANYVASNREIKGMLLMAPYSNQYDLYNRYIPVFYGPFERLVAFNMRADQFAQKVKISPTILASKSDEVVAYQSSKALAEKYPMGCNFITFEHYKHNDYWHEEETLSTIQEYFREELVK